MKPQSVSIQVGDKAIELSHPDKVLYPDDSLTKTDVAIYYQQVAPVMLKHISNRPLSLKRFPDGIHEEGFFQKNRPAGAPEWVAHASFGHGATQKDYVIATEEATLVWLANLACLELHQMHCFYNFPDTPDYFVFDLDPPAEYPFRQLTAIAIELKRHIESYGYAVFVKTSGGKGVHLLSPIVPRHDFRDVFKAVEMIARTFTASFPNETTLSLKKHDRKGRIFIDIFRNHPGQTIVSPYSLRARPGAPVSAPLDWEKFSETTDPKSFNLKTIPELLRTAGDPWQDFAQQARALHTSRS
ncbi:MAG: ATP-dependent DNA ligase [Chitinophagales bacterium]|nr:MAG: ATP-dependent DNA ligase [Chitinophagales bacterium]